MTSRWRRWRSQLRRPSPGRISVSKVGQHLQPEGDRSTGVWVIGFVSAKFLKACCLATWCHVFICDIVCSSKFIDVPYLCQMCLKKSCVMSFSVRYEAVGTCRDRRGISHQEEGFKWPTLHQLILGLQMGILFGSCFLFWKWLMNTVIHTRRGKT